MLIQPLFDGPLDLVGDVHGEIDALRALLGRLGYDPEGRHPAGRRLVFVGDLCDRGPDSPAVLRLVRTLVEAGRAQCVAGNHELNALRGLHKDGNNWLHGDDDERHRRRFGAQVLADEAVRAEAEAFFGGLPIALERADLRVVHAAWDEPAIAACRGLDLPLREAYDRFDEEARRSPLHQQLRDAHERAQRLHRARLHRHEDGPPAFLEAIAAFDEHHQMGNPIRVLTSGLERRLGAGETSFFAGGRWRFVKRVPWWREYRSDVPVVFGHYWRWYREHAAATLGESRGAEELADGTVGDRVVPGARTLCIDFSVGARFKERKQGALPPYQSRLCALRWDEGRLYFDGETPPA